MNCSHALAWPKKPTSVLLADEPTGNLDKANSLAIMELFSSFNRSGMTIVMVTHSPDVAAYASRQIHICDGKIIESFLGGTYYSSPIK